MRSFISADDAVRLYRAERARRPSVIGLTPEIVDELRAAGAVPEHMNAMTGKPLRMVAPRRGMTVRPCRGCQVAQAAWRGHYCTGCRIDRAGAARQRATQRWSAKMRKPPSPDRRCLDCQTLLAFGASHSRKRCNDCNRTVRLERERARVLARIERKVCIYHGCTSTPQDGKRRCRAHRKAHAVSTAASKKRRKAA